MIGFNAVKILRFYGITSFLQYCITSISLQLYAFARKKLIT